jgi:hypothetical protein
MPKNEKILDAFKAGFVQGFSAGRTRNIVTRKYAEGELQAAVEAFESTLNVRYSFDEHDTNSPSQ